MFLLDNKNVCVHMIFWLVDSLSVGMLTVLSELFLSSSQLKLTLKWKNNQKIVMGSLIDLTIL